MTFIPIKITQDHIDNYNKKFDEDDDKINTNDFIFYTTDYDTYGKYYYKDNPVNISNLNSCDDTDDGNNELCLSNLSGKEITSYSCGTKLSSENYMGVKFFDSEISYNLCHTKKVQSLIFPKDKISNFILLVFGITIGLIFSSIITSCIMCWLEYGNWSDKFEIENRSIIDHLFKLEEGGEGVEQEGGGSKLSKNRNNFKNGKVMRGGGNFYKEKKLFDYTKNCDKNTENKESDEKLNIPMELRIALDIFKSCKDRTNKFFNDKLENLSHKYICINKSKFKDIIKSLWFLAILILNSSLGGIPSIICLSTLYGCGRGFAGWVSKNIKYIFNIDNLFIFTTFKDITHSVKAMPAVNFILVLLLFTFFGLTITGIAKNDLGMLIPNLILFLLLLGMGARGIHKIMKLKEINKSDTNPYYLNFLDVAIAIIRIISSLICIILAPILSLIWLTISITFNIFKIPLSTPKSFISIIQNHSKLLTFLFTSSVVFSSYKELGSTTSFFLGIMLIVLFFKNIKDLFK